MPRLCFLVLLAWCALCAGPAWAASQVLTLCFERQQVLPWRTLDGHGLNFELLEEVGRRTGVKFEYQSMPWKRCLEQLRANQVDGAFAASFNAERAAIGAFPGGAAPDPAKRMHVDRYLLVRRRGSTIDWDGKAFHHVDGRIGFELGYSVGAFLREHKVPVDEGSQKSSELADKLIAGRLAAAAMGGGDAMRLIRGPVADRLEVLPVPLVEKPYFLVLSHALVRDRPQLAGRLWDAVEQVRESRDYKKREREAIAGTSQQLGGGGH
jgi:polar amino acid transport system substrate-binding protein